MSGRTLAELCAENIFGPLGMPDTTFTPTQEQSSRMMHLHSRAADGTLTSLAPAMPKDFEFYSGGAGSSGTGLDYLRFLRALLRGGELDGERILRKETVELAFADQLRGLPLPPGMRSAVPELTNDVPALPFAEGWGLGFHLILEDIPQMRRAGTGNWAGLANCYFWIDHSSGVAAAIFTQVLPFFDARIIGLTVGFEQAIHALVGEQAAR